MEAEASKTVIGAVKNSGGEGLLNQAGNSKKIKDFFSKPREQKKMVSSKCRVRKRETSPESVAMDVDEQPNKKMKLSSRSHAQSRPRDELMGLKDSAQKLKAVKLMKTSAVVRNKNARKGEGDRVILTLKPKHLYSSKRSKGKTHRR